MTQSRKRNCCGIALISAAFTLGSAFLLLHTQRPSERIQGKIIFPESSRKSNTTPTPLQEVTTHDYRKLFNTTDRNFTIVTSYFNLGVVQKGSPKGLRTPEHYRKWMRPYRYIRNGVVAFFDDMKYAATFREIRGNQLTNIVIVNRTDMWSFSMLNATEQIFAKPDYPKNYPKSTSPAYVAVMHSKSELLARVIMENPFTSVYFAWMDSGIYRSLPDNATSEFMLTAPRCLHDDSVMIGRVYRLSDTTIENVMRNGIDWVAGGFFLARADTMLDFCADYRNHTEAFLKMGLANHDQSVIQSMYLRTAKPRPVVPLQTVGVNNGDNAWFYFAMQLRKLALSGTEPSGSCLLTQMFT